MSATQVKPIVYLRPGCPFCSRLTSSLDHAGVEYDQVDIWDDPEAAAFVRSVANGNETVPTVVLAGTAHINPPPQLIIDAANS